MRRRTPPRWIEARLEKALGPGLGGQGVLGDLAEAYGRMRSRRRGVLCDLWYSWQALTLVAHRALGRGGAPRSLHGASPLAADVRWAVRVSLRRPVLTLGVVLTLGMGLGVNTAVFSVLDGTFRATSWWEAADRTLVLWPGHAFTRGQMSIFTQEATAFETLGAYRMETYAVNAGDGRTASLSGAVMTPALFRSLRVQPALGRGLAPEDAVPGNERTVVVSHGFWQRNLGGDPGVVGTRLEVNGEPRTIVGVQGPGGGAPGTATDLWLPLVMDSRDPDFWPAYDLVAVGVLRPGEDVAAGQEDLRRFCAGLTARFPFFFRPGYGQQATVRAAAEQERALVRTPLLLLMGGTLALLIIAALNVGNMLLARAVERRGELALRRALGANRGRIVRQLGTESALLALVGAGAGAVVAAPAAVALAGLFPAGVSVMRSGWTTPAVALFAALASLAAWSVLAGVPVASFLVGDRSGFRTAMRPRGSPPRALVVTQSALATVLLVAAVLLVGSVRNLRRIPLGFDARDVTAAALSPPADFLRDRGRLRQFQERLVEEARGLPGATAAGMTAAVPLDALPPETPVNVEGRVVPVGEAVQARRFAVDPGFFEVLALRVLDGRVLGSSERGSLPTAVVINRALAEALFPGGEAVGRRIAIDPHAWDRFIPIVGVVENLRAGSLVDAPGPAIYVALHEQAARETALLVRGESGPAGIGALLRNTVARVDPAVPVGSIRPLEGIVRDAYGTAWVTMGLLGALALLATVLAALGIHAVLTHHVARQRREIGVRLALGAQRAGLVARIMRSGVTSTAIGVALGWALAAGLVRLLRSFLFGVAGLAPWAFVLTAAAVVAAAVLAAWLPAMRAGRLPPAEVLRAE
jgi:predicted permease